MGFKVTKIFIYPKPMNFGPGPLWWFWNVVPIPPISVIKINEQSILVKYEPQLDAKLNKANQIYLIIAWSTNISIK